MGYYYGGFAPYVSVGQLKMKAKKYIRDSYDAGIDLHPVELEGRQIAKSWWGKSWCANLERYADYASRLERGRKYVRANCVVDLQIESGLVTALVMGSKKKPYKIKVTIDELSEKQLDTLISRCSSKIQTLEDLVNGKFPDELKSIFTEKDVGLFPSMAKIHFNCSCPDWADMCKHTAAVLYAIGARFDDDPLLFFTLRGIDTEKLVGNVVQNRIEQMLSNANAKSKRIMEDNEIAEVFGI